jgi:ABC-type glycerol-3-phosphate transport system substrate-binding protein
MRCSKRACLVWVLVVGLAASCGGAGNQPSPAASPLPASPTPHQTSLPKPTSTSSVPPLEGRVTLWLDWGPNRMQTMLAAIHDFKARHPQVDFDVSYYPTSELRSAFEAEAAAHQGPSVVIGPSTWGPAFMDQGWIRDISPFLLPSQQSSIQPVVWGQVADSTRVLGLPLTLEGNVLYRNTSLVPDPALSVDGLIQATTALKAEQGFGASLDFGFLFSVPQLAACGVALDTQAVLPFDEAGGECWLGLMQRLGQAGKPVFNSDDDRSRFEAGQSAWLVDSSLEIDNLGQAIGDSNLAIDPWPLDETTGGRLNGYVWSENAYLTTTSSRSDLEASWAFLAYLLAPETQAAMDDVEGARRIPSVVAAPLTDPILTQARQALETGLPRPFPEDLNRLTGPLDTALRLVVGQAGDIQLTTMLTLQEIGKANLATPTLTASPTPSATSPPSPIPTSTEPPATASPTTTPTGP